MTFIEKLQSSDDATKRRWLIGSTAIIMIIIVALWIAYFNTLVAPARPLAQVSGDASSGTNTTLTTSKPGFFATIGNGIAVVYNGFISGIRNLGSILTGPRTIILKPGT